MINVNVLVKSDNFKIVASNPLFTEDIFEQLISYAKLQKGVDQPHTTVGAFMEPIIADGGIHKCLTYIYDIQNHWILDIRATGRMVHDLSMFTKISEPSNVTIKLPNNIVTTLFSFLL